MIYSLKGNLTAIKENFVVISCSGVGYKCMCSAITRASLEKNIEKEVTVYTYLSVHQDSVELFGFADEKELEYFKLLISVSGIGPKVALGILSRFPALELAKVISTGDCKLLTSAPGIGAKTAKRVILELKDKFGKLSSDENSMPTNGSIELKNKKSEALKALMFLGYSRSEIMPWLSNLSENLSVEEMINSSLKNMGKGG